jgi:hypothetical protein
MRRGEVVHAGDDLDGVVEAVAVFPAVTEDLVVVHPADDVLGAAIAGRSVAWRSRASTSGRHAAPRTSRSYRDPVRRLRRIRVSVRHEPQRKVIGLVQSTGPWSVVR